MGLSKTQRDVTFLSLSEGQIVMRVPEPTETSVSRKITKGKNEGNIVHEEKFDKLTGFITGLEVEHKDVPFQKEKFSVMKITMQDGDDIFKIEWPLGSSYSRSLITRLENVDYSEEVEFSTYWIQGDDEKYRGFVGLKQGGEKIEPRYEKEDLPEVKKVKVGKDKFAYNDEELLEFYEKVVNSLGEQLKDAAPEVNSSTPSQKPEDDEYQSEEESGEQEQKSEKKGGKLF